MDGGSAQNIEDVSRILLEGFFESLDVHEVTRASGAPVGGGPRAAQECSRALAQLDHSRSGVRGVSFVMKDRVGSASQWTIFFYPGPFPRLDLSTAMDRGFCPSARWPRILLQSGIPAVIWYGGAHVGRSDLLYLLLKTEHLFLGAKTTTTAQGVAAAEALRGACLLVSQAHYAVGPVECKSKFWKRGTRVFARQFERHLIALVGVTQLQQWLAALNIGLDQWRSTAS
jgi:hypothetical protein